jgi:short-subunit dehydrogenase
MVMGAADLVDAAIAGLDSGETVTMPSLRDVADWQAYDAARKKLASGLSRDTPAPRYRVTAAGAAGA